MGDLEIRRSPKSEPVVDLTPILDTLVSVIFFLLLFSVFGDFAQLSLSPSERASQATTKEPALDAAAMPTLVLSGGQGNVRLELRWMGEKPGRLVREVAGAKLKSKEAWITQVQDAIRPFLESHPKDEGIRVGLDRGFNYQHLVLALDALRPHFKDVALMAPDEVRASLQGSN